MAMFNEQNPHGFFRAVAPPHPCHSLPRCVGVLDHHDVGQVAAGIRSHGIGTQAPEETGGTLWLCQQLAIENGHL